MRTTLLLLVSLSLAAASSAQVFTHDELGCLTTEHFPVVEATVDAAELPALQKAQVYFKAGQSDEWYFVEMERGYGSRLRAVLPKPLPETGSVDYYLFFLTGSFGTSQSSERSVRVSENGCDGAQDLVGGSSVSLTLKATVPNQIPIPPGFQPQGIASLVTTAGNTVTVGAAAGSAGVSGATVGVIAGVGAAAAGTAVAVSGGDSDVSGDSADATATSSAGDASSSGGGAAGGPSGTAESSPASPTPPPPPPEPTVPDVSGRWLMSHQITETCYPEDLGRRSDRLLAIDQEGASLSATFVETSIVGNFAGRIDSLGNLTLDGRVVDTEGATSEVHMEATTNGETMSGSMRTVYVHNGCVVRSTLSGRKR